MKQLGFAIVGSGSIAPTHAQCLQEMEGVKLVAAQSRSEAKVRAFAAEYGCDAYVDYAEMLARTDLDAVIICTPSGVHADLGIQAAKAGKHVVMEKPIDISLEKADALIVACREAGVKLAVISQRRYGPGIERLKEVLNKGELGPLYFGGCYMKLYRSQEYFDSGAWRGTWDLDGGGVLMNQGIHYIDLLQYLMGPVEEVSASCRTVGHQRIEVEDLAAVRLKFKNGALGIIEATTNAYPGLTSRIDVYGLAGTAVIENDVLVQLRIKDGVDFVKEASNDSAGVSSPAITYDNHKRQLEQMVEAIRNNAEPAVNGEEGRKPLEIILAVYKSAYSHETVKLPLSDSKFMASLAREAKQRQGFNF